MKVIDLGHMYSLNQLDSPTWAQQLTFVKREGEKYPGNVGHYPGTNLQDVLRVCINRLDYLNDQVYNWRNEECKENLQNCISLLEERAAERHGRSQNTWPDDVETYPTCNICGHIYPETHNHKEN